MSLIKKPHHTEKALGLNNKSQYTFIVKPSANKIEIRKKIEREYKVKVCSVNTCFQKGKKVKRYAKERLTRGKRPGSKKAIITLKEGDFIDVYVDNI